MNTLKSNRTALLRLVLAFPLFAVGALPGAETLPANGNFEKADPTNPKAPAHWDLPDGLGVRWADASVTPGGAAHGKAIRMDTAVSEKAMVASWEQAGITQWNFPKPAGNAIAETYGLSLYSEEAPLVAGKAYEVSFDYFSEKGTAGKVWFRGYGDLGGKRKRLYEGIVDCASKGEWRHFSGVFHPTKNTPKVTGFKVMLFAFYPPGVCWYDNVVVKAVEEPAGK